MSHIRIYLLDVKEGRFSFIRSLIIEERRKERQTVYLLAQRALAQLPLRRAEDTLLWTGPDPEDTGRKGIPHKRFGASSDMDFIRRQLKGKDGEWTKLSE